MKAIQRCCSIEWHWNREYWYMKSNYILLIIAALGSILFISGKDVDKVNHFDKNTDIGIHKEELLHIYEKIDYCFHDANIRFVEENSVKERIPDELELELESAFVQNKVEVFAEKYKADYRILSQKEKEYYIENYDDGKLTKYCEEFDTEIDDWFTYDNNVCIIRHAIDDNRYVYFRYCPEKVIEGIEEPAFILRALGDNEEYYFIQWDEKVYLLTTIKEDEKLTGIVIYSSGDWDYGRAVYKGIKNENMETAYFCYAYEPKQMGTYWPNIEAWKTINEICEKAADDMPRDNDVEDEYSIEGKRIEEAYYLYNMHSLDFIEEDEAQRYFEEDFINSIRTSIQEKCLPDTIVKLQADCEILEEEERNQLLDKEKEEKYWYLYGYQYHVESREDIWMQIPNSNNTMDIVILNNGELGQKEYYYFCVNKDGKIYDLPERYYIFNYYKEGLPYFIKWNNHMYMAVPYITNESGEISGVVISALFILPDSTKGPHIAGIWLNEDNSTEVCYQGCITNQNPKYIYNNTPIMSHSDVEASRY